MKRDKAAALQSAPILRLMLTFSGGTLAALVLSGLYTLTDTLFVSYAVGAQAVGGISVAFPFVMFQSAVSTALGGGAATLVSQKMGKNEPAAAGEIALNAMLTFWLTALLVTVLGLLSLDGFLRYSGLSGSLYSYAREYLQIILLGNLFSTGFSSVIRAEGNIRYGVLIWVIPVALNILLDYLFLLHWAFGVRGSAIATVLAQFVSFSMSLLFFARFSVLRFRGARLHIKTVLRILAIGLPSLVQQSGLALSLAVMNMALGRAGGEGAVTVYGFIYRILVFAYYPFLAVTQALSPVASSSYAAEKHDRVRAATRIAMAMAVGSGILLCALLCVFPESVLRLLTDDGQVLTEGVPALRKAALSLPFVPVSLVAGTLLQSQGRVKASLFLQSSGSVLCLFPVLLALWLVCGLDGVWYAPFAAALLSAALTAVCFLRFRRM